jgi:hypothetical protein
MFETSEINLNPKRLIISVAATSVLLVLTVYILPTILFSIFGGFTMFLRHEAFSIKSADNRFVVRVVKRVNFPVDSLFSPSGTVQVSLRNGMNNSQINEVEFYVHEYGEVTQPIITWNSTRVMIENIEYHNDVSIWFRLPELE